MMPKHIEIAFSENKFDQQRLAESGGNITFKTNGRPVFRFDNEQQYQKYLQLNEKRPAVAS